MQDSMTHTERVVINRSPSFLSTIERPIAENGCFQTTNCETIKTIKKMICIITDNELARSHGVGAQILQMFQRAKFHHFYWKIGHGQKSEVPESTLLADWIPNVRKIGGVVRRLRRLAGITWWHDNQINVVRLHRFVQAQELEFDVAYVVVARETSADRALSIVRALKLPYVVHMMDVLHEHGLDPVSMPAVGELLKGASGLLALLPSIAEEMGKFSKAPVQIIPVGKSLAQQIALPPASDEPIRMIIGGRPYRGGCQLLAKAWKNVKHNCRKVELSYVGPHYRDIPTELMSECCNVGFLRSDEDYQHFLATAHLAFLSGPDADDMHGKWSFPSRTVDHLMAGLPVLACVPAGSATEKVLGPISPQAVAFTRSGADIIEAINRFTAEQDVWVSASRAARFFVEKTMSLDVVREKVFAALESAMVEK
jgi:hypothetical protein